VCKIFESILREAVLEHVSKYNLIKDSQHSVVRRRSCWTKLLKFMEIVTNCIDQGFPIDVIYLDFQTAFDQVPHTKLMLKVIKSLVITGLVFD
jgi:hypothetical protein